MVESNTVVTKSLISFPSDFIPLFSPIDRELCCEKVMLSPFAKVNIYSEGGRRNGVGYTADIGLKALFGKGKSLPEHLKRQ